MRLKKGERVTQILEYIKKNGPQTRQQLRNASLLGNAGNTIDTLVKQGRLQKVTVANPLSNKNDRTVVTAYKFVDGAKIGILSPIPNTQRRIDNAIKLLEQNGYTVSPNAKLSRAGTNFK